MPAHVGSSAPTALVQMRTRSLEQFAASAEESFSANPADAPAVRVHRVAFSVLVYPGLPSAIGFADVRANVERLAVDRVLGLVREMRPAVLHLLILASGLCGCVQSSFDPFFFRFRSICAKSARVGVLMPEALASVFKKLAQGERVAGAPRDPTLRVNALEIANQEQPK